jgi:hypothetical protein
MGYPRSGNPSFEERTRWMMGSAEPEPILRCFDWRERGAVARKAEGSREHHRSCGSTAAPRAEVRAAQTTGLMVSA